MEELLHVVLSFLTPEMVFVLCVGFLFYGSLKWKVEHSDENLRAHLEEARKLRTELAEAVDRRRAEVLELSQELDKLHVSIKVLRAGLEEALQGLRHLEDTPLRHIRKTDIEHIKGRVAAALNGESHYQ